MTGLCHVEVLIPNSPSVNTTVLNMINGTLSENSGPGEPVLRLADQDLEIWNRFCSRTVATLGAVGTSHLYQKATPWLSCSVCHSASFLLLSAALELGPNRLADHLEPVPHAYNSSYHTATRPISRLQPGHRSRHRIFSTTAAVYSRALPLLPRHSALQR